MKFIIVEYHFLYKFKGSQLCQLWSCVPEFEQKYINESQASMSIIDFSLSWTENEKDKKKIHIGIIILVLVHCNSIKKSNAKEKGLKKQQTTQKNLVVKSILVSLSLACFFPSFLNFIWKYNFFSPSFIFFAFFVWVPFKCSSVYMFMLSMCFFHVMPCLFAIEVVL